MNRNKRSRTPRTLELKKETVVVLSKAMLEDVIGGGLAANSVHLSMCDSPCNTNP